MLGNQFFAASWSRRLTCLTSQGGSGTVKFLLVMPLIKPAGDTDTTAPLARDSAWAEVSRRLKVLQKRLTAEEPSENTISPLAGTARGRGNNAKSIGRLSEQMDKQAVILEFLTSAIDKQAAMLERIESREVERERAREKEKELLESRFVHHITAMSEKIGAYARMCLRCIVVVA